MYPKNRAPGEKDQLAVGARAILPPISLAAGWLAPFRHQGAQLVAKNMPAAGLIQKVVVWVP